MAGDSNKRKKGPVYQTRVEEFDCKVKGYLIHMMGHGKFKSICNLPCPLLTAQFCAWACEVMIGCWVGRKTGRNSS